MSQRPSTSPPRPGSGIKRYDPGNTSPKPPGAITSPIRSRPRQHRALSIMSAEIAKHSPGDSHIYTMPDADQSRPRGTSNGGENSSPISAQSRSRSASRQSSPIRTVRQSTNLKSLAGSSYNLDEFYASMKPSSEKASSSSDQEKLFHRSPLSSPILGSPTQRAAAEASDRRRSRSPRKKFIGGEDAKKKKDPRDRMKRQQSSKLQLLDDLLAQVKNTHAEFAEELGSAKKDAKRLMVRSERSNRRLTYTKTQVDDALDGAADSVAVMKSLAQRHTLGALPDKKGRLRSSPMKARWRRTLRRISFKSAVTKTKRDLLSRSSSAAHAHSSASDEADVTDK